jgi:hypothetical protein
MGVYKFSDASSLATDKISYKSMLAGNTTWIDWQPAGAYDALATVTAPSGGLSSVTFAAIPNNYRQLQIRCFSLKSSNPGTLLRINGDGTVGNYPQRILYGTGSGTAQTYTDPNYAGFVWGLNDTGTSTIPAISIIDILDYSSTTKLKVMRTIGGSDANGSGNVYFSSGMNKVITDPINSITLVTGANFNQHSQFTLYGIR